MNNGPFVSIIISAYNAEKHIALTIESVLVQEWKELEIIVVNDGSTDETSTILHGYGDQIIDITLYIKQKILRHLVRH